MVSWESFRTARPKRVDALTREFGDELLIYDMRTHRAHCLNKTAASVWQTCDGKATISEIVERLAPLAGTNESLVYLALGRLERAGLLERSEAAFQDRLARTRREALRKLGMAATLALPVVTSMLVPEPANAASCFPLLHACSNNAQCCSGHCGLSGVNLVCLP